jgi:dienelactone hydrolase
MHTVTAFSVSLALLVALPAAAQQRFMYPAPAPGAVDVQMNVPYAEGLQMDVYRPRTASGPMPVLVFFNLATGAQRGALMTTSWARVAAAEGIVAVLPDLTFEEEAQQLDALLRYLTTHGAELGIDPNAIAVFAASGNVFRSLPLLQDPTRTAVRSAVLYYGTATVSTFRSDLPMLFVRAGLDRPPVNVAMDELVTRALANNAPVTLLNYPSGHHAFETIDDSLATRAVIDQTIAFVKQTTSSPYRDALQAGRPEAEAAGHVVAGRFAEAAPIYATLVAARGDDSRLRLAFAEALLGNRQFRESCAEFAKLKDAPLGPRDRGVPAARACLQSGDPDAAIAWIASIPVRFRPRELETDPMFAPLRSRADFTALFREGR